MDWFIKLFPEGWVIEPETNLYKFLKVVSNRLDEISQWIDNKKKIIPKSDDPELSRWERMTGIEVVEEGTARVENIRNKLIGSWGHFTEVLVKKIIQFHTVGEFEVVVTNSVPLRCGVAKAGQRLVAEDTIFYLKVHIKRAITSEAVREAIEEHLNKVKHAHLKLHIKYGE